MHIKKFIFTLFIVVIFSCDNGIMMPEIDSLPEPDVIEVDIEVEPDFVYDNSRDIVVFQDNGESIDIVSYDENLGDEVKCIRLIDSVTFDLESSSRNSVGGRRLRAVVIGMREDENPGLWLLFENGAVESPIDEDTGERSPLLDKVKYRNRFGLDGFYNAVIGWDYTPTMISDNGLMVGGYAINENGFQHGSIGIDPGTKAAVYWRLFNHSDDQYVISSARVVGTLDIPEYTGWYARFLNEMARMLKLLFLDYLDDYLLEPEDLVYLDEEDLYKMTGPNKAGNNAEASISFEDVLSIEELDYANNPPVAEFATWDLEVRSAEDASVNLDYIITGTAYGRPVYSAVGGSSKVLFYYWNNSSFSYGWGINDVALSSILNENELDYYHDQSNSIQPPSSGWKNGLYGTASSLAIKIVPIEGDVSNADNIISASYIFSDPDGDGEGGSLYQWYRCDSPADEGVAIPGAVNTEYMITKDDFQKYLRFEVIPVDSRGMQGLPVKSEASDVVGST